MTTITVRTSAELKSAVYQLSKTGGTILVENGGQGYDLTIANVGSAGSTITITAADPDNPPDFDHIKLTNATNLSFQGLLFDSSDPATDAGQDIGIYNSTNVTFANITMIGSASEYLGTGSGAVIGGNAVKIEGSTNVTFTGSSVAGYGHGITVKDSIGTVISDNDISALQFDGVRLIGVQDTQVVDNYIHNFLGADYNLNHPDMIQVFSSASTKLNTENLTISGNVLIADDVGTQTIFIRNETQDSTGTAYKNITITDNTIYNGNSHGISVSGTDGVTIADNTLLWNSDAVIRRNDNAEGVSSAPSIRVSSASNAVVSNNVSSGYALDGNVVSTDNVTISYNSSSSGYVGDNFVNASNSGAVDLRDLQLLESSGISGHGSSVTQPGVVIDAVTAVLQQKVSMTEGGSITYDASLSHNARGLLDPASTTYLWTFGDGTTAEGMIVSHTYAVPGRHSVTLSVVTATGETDTITRSSTTTDDLLVRLGFNDGVVDGGNYSPGLTVIGGAAATAGLDGAGFHLDGASKVKIASGQITGMQNFTLGLSVKLDETNDNGMLVHYYRALQVSISRTGAVVVTVDLADGTYPTIASATGLVNDDEWHRISLAVEGGNGGKAVLYIDGEAAGEVALTAGLKFSSTYSLVIGNTFGGSVQATVDDVTLLSTVRGADWAVSDYQETFGLTRESGASAGTDSGALAPEMDAGVAESGTEPDDAAVSEPAKPEFVLPAALAAGLAAKSGGIAVTELDSPLDNADLLRIDFDSGYVDTSTNAALLWTKGTTAANLVEGVDGTAFHLDGTSKLYVDRTNGFLQKDRDSFTISVSLKLDRGNDSGVFLHLHKGFMASVEKNGSIRFSVETENGWVAAYTAKGLLSDGDWHRLSFSYDGTEGGSGIQIYVDGELAGSAEQTGTVAFGWPYHVVIGNTFNGSISATVDDLAMGSSALSTGDAASDYASMASKLAANAAVGTQIGVYSQDGYMIGTEGADLILGTDGDDLIFARGGADTIDGGAGVDMIVWDRAPVAGEADRIIGFDEAGGDRLLFQADLFDLDTGAASGGAASGGAVLDEAQFALSGQAPGAETRFIYDAGTGALYWDADGSGEAEAVRIAQLDPGTLLTHHAFLVF